MNNANIVVFLAVNAFVLLAILFSLYKPNCSLKRAGFYYIPALWVVVSGIIFIIYAPHITDSRALVDSIVTLPSFVLISSLLFFCLFNVKRDYLIKTVFAPILAGLLILLFFSERVADFGNGAPVTVLKSGLTIVVGLAVVQATTGFIGYCYSLLRLATGQPSSPKDTVTDSEVSISKNSGEISSDDINR